MLWYFSLLKVTAMLVHHHFFWRELQKVVSGKEKYYTGGKKYCKALSRQRKHLVISEELPGYNLGQSLALTALSAYHFPVPSALSGGLTYRAVNPEYLY